MPILTQRTFWTRRSSAKAHRQATARPTPQECANVRRVIRHLIIEHGSPAALARAMGITKAALGKAQLPSRLQSPRLAFICARVAGVGVDDVLAGRWIRVACPDCGEQVTF